MLTTTWKRCINAVNGSGRLTKFAENKNKKIENFQNEIDDLELKLVDEKNPMNISEITLKLAKLKNGIGSLKTSIRQNDEESDE